MGTSIPIRRPHGCRHFANLVSELFAPAWVYASTHEYRTNAIRGERVKYLRKLAQFLMYICPKAVKKSGYKASSCYLRCFLNHQHFWRRHVDQGEFNSVSVENAAGVSIVKQIGSPETR